MTATTEGRIRVWIKCAAGNISSSLNDELLHIVDAAIEEAEAAAAARQRAADAAVCRAKADEFRELLVDEAVQAASECAVEILAGGGGAGGGTTE
jgi:hypothetical protein